MRCYTLSRRHMFISYMNRDDVLIPKAEIGLEGLELVNLPTDFNWGGENEITADEDTLYFEYINTQDEYRPDEWKPMEWAHLKYDR